MTGSDRILIPSATSISRMHITLHIVDWSDTNWDTNIGIHDQPTKFTGQCFRLSWKQHQDECRWLLLVRHPNIMQPHTYMHASKPGVRRRLQSHTSSTRIKPEKISLSNIETYLPTYSASASSPSLLYIIILFIGPSALPIYNWIPCWMAVDCYVGGIRSESKAKNGHTCTARPYPLQYSLPIDSGSLSTDARRLQ